VADERIHERNRKKYHQRNSRGNSRRNSQGNKKTRSFWLAVFLSIFGHLLVFIGVLYLRSTHNIPAIPQSTLNVEVIEIPGSGSEVGKKRSQPRNKEFNPKSTARRIRLKDLGIQIDGPGNFSKKFESEDEAIGSRERTGLGQDDGVQIVKDRNIGLYEFIYQQIDSNLVYPSEFVSAQIEGTVESKLYFDQNGKYQRSKSEFRTPYDYLRVLILRTLRRALAEAVSDQVNKLKKPFYLHCVFRFYIVQNNDQGLIQAQKMITGNSLTFYRSFYKSKLEWELGPFQGLGPFAVGFSPLWIFEKGKDLISKRIKVDPLEKYRNDPEW